MPKCGNDISDFWGFSFFLYLGNKITYYTAKAISVFTNDSIGNIYMKKVRMKAKISESDSKDKDVILEYLL